MKAALFPFNILLIVVYLTACSGNKGLKDGVITIWAWNPRTNVNIMNRAKDIYAGDVEIEVVEMGRGDIERKLHTAFSAAGDLPDIVLIEDYQASKFLSSYPGKFADLSNDIDYSLFVPSKVKAVTYEGKKYAVPFDLAVAGTFLRNDLITDADVAAARIPNVTTFEQLVTAEITWDDYIELGKAYTARTGKAFLSINFPYQGIFRIILSSAKSWFVNTNDEFYFVGNPAVEEAARIYKTFYNTKVDYNGTPVKIYKAATDWSTWVAPLSTDEVATITAGVWITSTVKSTEANSGKWTVMKTPRPNLSSAVNYSDTGGSSWYVLEDGDKEEAIVFLKTIYQDNKEGFYDQILANNGSMGSLLSAKTSTEYLKHDPFFSNASVREDFANWAAKVPALDYGKYTYEASEALTNAMSGYFDGTKDLTSFLKEAEEAAKTRIQ